MVRIAFTGGSGKAGRHVIPELIKAGHTVLNLDLIPFPDASLGVYTLKTDLTDSGQVFNALTSLEHLDAYGQHEDHWKQREVGGVLGPPDVLIHFAAYSRDMIVPDNVTFASNTQSTYNVVEAACKLGVKKIIIASSETTYGVCFTQGNEGNDYKSFPLLEDYDVDPMDSYGLSKQMGEIIGRSFQRRFSKSVPPKDGNSSSPGSAIDIYVFRIGNVVEPHEYERDFKTYLMDVDWRKRNAWSYIDARELGRMCDSAIKTSGLGFQIFNATNDTASSLLSTKELISIVAPNTPMVAEWLTEDEAPLSNRKMRKMLGYQELKEWHWKTILENAGWDLKAMEKELRQNLVKDGRLKQ